MRDSKIYSAWHELAREPRDLIGDFTKHVHNAYELILVKEGTLKVEINDKNYKVPPKSLIICNNIEMHLLTPTAYPYERYGLHITLPGLKRVPVGIAYHSIINNHPQHFNNVFDVSDCFDEFEDMFERIFAEISVHHSERSLRDEHSEELAACLIGELLIRLNRRFPDRVVVRNPKSDVVITNIRQYIDENFTRDISINELARDAFISHTSFINAFKRLTGYSPKHYLLMCRLSEAKVQLCSTNRSITDISFNVGFGDPNSFIRFFRQEIGMTPGEYRKINRYPIDGE